MFTNEKITQVAAYLLNKAGGRINYTAFLKLLYMADKKMLIEWNVPITYDNWYSMPHGPVLSNTYNLIRGNNVDLSYWSDYIHTIGYDVEVQNQPGDDLLSEAEEEVIASIFEEHGGKTWKQLVAITHDFAEWDDPQGSSKTISYTQVLEIEGFSREKITEIIQNIEIEKSIEKSIASANLENRVK